MYVCIEHNAKVWVLGTLCELWISDLDNILACPRSCDLKYAICMENGARKRLREFISFILRY